MRAPHATRVQLCLFEDGDETRLDLVAIDGEWFSVAVPDVGPGAAYGFRLEGRWDPVEGIYTNPAKLLLDPYARSISGKLRPSPALVVHRPRREEEPDPRDNSSFVPRSVVADPNFDWGPDRAPRTPWSHTLIYETHVKGLTMLHPSVPPDLRGTYAGATSPPVLEHLTALGVTAVELLPVQYSITEPWLARRDLTNYWGYSTVGLFAPHPGYAATSDPVAEFKAMVKSFHEAGIEVILDVVYNHTGEGSHLGPVLSFRGFDNPGFYRLDPNDKRRYLDWTGTGNSVDMTKPWALELAIDSLRYWASEMHVDGFRFDLAVTMGRTDAGFDREAPIFKEIASDPVLSRLKLIAEPWDLGPDGYRIGGFPSGWAEWNGRFRDDVREFWRNHDGTLAALATRITGSSDLFGDRLPTASINFVTAHDGFTLNDLVSYNHKHNQVNREQNRDGESHNRSWNTGVEGESDDPAINRLRKTRARSLLVTLFMSRGVPMLLGGDELGRSQGGNNNAYGQDNPVSWYDWPAMDWEMTAFVQRLAEIRRQHQILTDPTWLSGRPPDGGASPNDPLADVAWFRPDGSKMDDGDWKVPHAHTLAVFFNGLAVGPRERSLLMLLNSRPVGQVFSLPPQLRDRSWTILVDTAEQTAELGVETLVAPFATVVAQAQ